MVRGWRQIHMAPAEPCDFPARLHPPSPGHIWSVLKSSCELQGVLGNGCEGALTCLAPHSPQQPPWLLQSPPRSSKALPSPGYCMTGCSGVEGLKTCRSVTEYQGFWWLLWVLAALQLFGHLWQLLLASDAAAIAFKLMMQLGLI